MLAGHDSSRLIGLSSSCANLAWLALLLLALGWVALARFASVLRSRGADTLTLTLAYHKNVMILCFFLKG